MNEIYGIRPIGIVKSSLKMLDDCPLQEKEGAPQATIEIFTAFTEGISSLRPGARVIVLTWLDKADRSVLRCFPRREVNAPPMGVFSTRSPDRPNPIGLHETVITSITGNRLTVSNLEVLDGTPVLDLKPVIN